MTACVDCQVQIDGPGRAEPHAALKQIDQKDFTPFARPKVLLNTYQCQNCAALLVNLLDYDEKDYRWHLKMTPC